MTHHGNDMRAKGFTLIELIIVIAILAILAVMAVPRLLNFGTSAKDAGLSSLEGAINSGLKMGYTKMAVEDLERLAYASNYSIEGSTPRPLPFVGCDKIDEGDPCAFSFGYPYPEEFSLPKVVDYLDSDDGWAMVRDSINGQYVLHITWDWNAVKGADNKWFLKENHCYVTYYPAKSEIEPARVTKTDCE